MKLCCAGDLGSSGGGSRPGSRCRGTQEQDPPSVKSEPGDSKVRGENEDSSQPVCALVDAKHEPEFNIDMDAKTLIDTCR